MRSLDGVHVALLTPFDASGRVDEAALRGHLDALILAGVSGVVPCGSTGEVMILDPDEVKRVIGLTMDHVAGRVAVIAGCTANATHHAIANCRAAAAAGVDALMIAHPFYSHPEEAELYEHYAAIAATVDRPIVVYNNPGTSGIDISPELLGRLSLLPHIDYVKENSSDASRVTRILEASEGRMAVLTGSDHLALDMFVTGATGWISGTANVLAAQAVALFDLVSRQGGIAAAREIFREIHPFVTYAETSGHGIQAIKASMALLGRPMGDPRAPLRRLPDATFAVVRPLVERALAAPLPALDRA